MVGRGTGMNRVWLMLGLVTVFVSGCTAETFPILVPPLKEPMVRQISLLVDEDSGIRIPTDYEGGVYKDVTVISTKMMRADGWLYSWAKESVTLDSAESDSEWVNGWLERARWMYANGFVATERRCAEGRDELAGLIETYATILRLMRPHDSSPYRMAVAHTLWQTLPEGNADCSSHLAELSIRNFMPVIDDGVVFYAFAFDCSRTPCIREKQASLKITIVEIGVTE